MRFVIPIAALLVLWSMPAFGINITQSASAPTSNVEISQTTISDYYPTNPKGHPFEAIRKTANAQSPWREIGQTFTVSSTFTLDKITLMVSQYDDPNYPPTGIPDCCLDLYMDVYDAGGNVNAPNGTSLTGSPGTGVMPTIPVHSTEPANSGDIVWMTFDVTNVELTQGEVYGFRLGLNYPSVFNGSYQLGSSGADVGGIYLNRNGNPYDGGKMFRYHPSNGVVFGLGTPDVDNLGDTDLVFILQSAQAGDFNGDGDVNAADYVTLRKRTDTPEDYNTWRANFGSGDSSAGALVEGGSLAVPEPASLILASAALLALVWNRRPMTSSVQRQ